jgi:phosphoribosylaminoimidazolecarboxamide formyltransferase/IMP cyclohydrolase
MGVEILATGGTRKLLLEAGLNAREVSEVTGFPEMMDGRVKTLHPRVHGGILARRDLEDHVRAMHEHDILPIDMVVVNLYPFEETVKREGVSREEAIEKIDIGGPSMVRSAAKNHADVAIVTDPDDYGRVLDEMQRDGGSLSDELRRELARKAFGLTARYDAAISRWLLREESAGAEEVCFPESFALAGAKVMDLRYGENPHQSAAFFRVADCAEPGVATADFLGGKELSYNNLVDLDGALGLAKEFEQPFACVVKHTNPCGAACGEKIEEALELAWAGDPLSAFGSVLAFTRDVNLPAAEFLVSENRFVEAIIAPAFDEDALELLRTGPKWGKNVRLLACGKIGPESRDPSSLEVKVLTGGFLAQTRDLVRESTDMLKCVTKKEPSDEQIESLLFGNKITKHVKSNSIVITKGLRVLGVGAGQMSRVDSVKIAAEKSGAEAEGAVLASDAFFPFPDGVEAAVAAGVKAFVQPGGSIRDKQVIETCDELGVSMIFTGKRHFRH